MAFIASARTLGPTLVLRRFQVSSTAHNGLYVEIVGRPEGLLGWLLTTIGLDAQVSYSITDTDVTIESAGLQGNSREITPISNIASASVGYMKSFWTLIFGILAVVYGLYSGLLKDSSVMLGLGLLVGGILLVRYWLSNRLHIAVITNGGSVLGLRFKRSVIEGVAVDFEKCAAVIDTLQSLMLAAQARRDIPGGATAPAAIHSGLTPQPTPQRQAATPQAATTAAMRPAAATAPAATPASRPAPAPVAHRCAKCGTMVEPQGKFCENCGTRVDAPQ